MINVICVKWGHKYTAQDVNNLLEMVKKHLPRDFTFHCYTEDPTGISPQVNIIPIEKAYQGVWNKLALFNLDLGTTLYFDLDLYIQNDLTPLLDKQSFHLIQCYWKPIKDIGWWDHNINSSVMLWEGLENQHLYHDFADDPEGIMSMYPGMDHFIYREEYDYDVWPEGLIYSRSFGRKAWDWHFPSPEPYWMDDGIVCLFNGPKELIQWDETLIH